MIRHHDVDVGDGLRLHLVESGQGPAVTLLHGFTGSTDNWDFLRPQLDDRYRLIAIDQPGHGKSSSPGDPARYGLDRFAGDIARLLDALDIDKSVVLGYSMGARAALRFAIASPERTSGLILESASPGIPDATERKKRAEADAILATSIERDGIAPFVERWEKLALWNTQSSLSDEVKAALRRQRLANDAKGLANSLRGAGAGADADVLESARGITTPTLLIAGERDTKYVGLAADLARAIPNSDTLVVPGAGHAIHLEKPEDFASAVDDFLARILRA